MKKLNLLLTLLLICSISSAQVQQEKNFFKTTAFKKMPKTHVKAETTIEPVLVLEEDFSLFTAGSEDAPDNQSITTSYYTVKNEYTHEPDWIGYNVYQAGGACALLQYTDPYYGETRYGHISTPERELYGEATVTFRARRANSNPDAGSLWLAICDNYSGVEDDTTIELTNEWQTYTWTTTKATFNANNIFQFTPQNGEILLDDIKVTRVRNKIPGTTALSPINTSVTEFTARWMPATSGDVTGYIFNAYYLDMPAEIVEPGTLEIDFESINLKADNTSIEIENPGYPDGWEIDVTTYGKKDMCTDNGDFNSGKQAINFDAAGDYIISPVAPAPIHKLSFWVKPSNMQYESYNYSLVGVSVKSEDSDWEHIANLPNYWMQENGGEYVIEGDALGKYITQVRLTCESSYDVTFAIDDIQLEYATQPVPCKLIVDELVTDTFRTVRDIDPSKEHYYYVQVKEGELLSDPGMEVWVDGIEGVTPVALPASDINSTGFTANWEIIHNADRYKLDVSQEYITRQDNEEVVMVYEDFSKITDGTLSSPSMSWYTTHNLADNNQSETEWMLTQPQWVEGMAGSRGTSWMGEAGLVLSPKMVLGKNTIKVDVTAYNTVPGDTLWVMVIEEYNSSQAIVGKQVGFSTDATDYVTGTVTFSDIDFGSKPLHVAFMSQLGTAFYIDEAKVSAIVPNKETSIIKPFKVINATEGSYTFSNLAPDESVYTYCVTAKRTKDFYDYISEISEVVTVKLPSSVTAVASNNNYIYASDGKLCIVTEEASEVTIYSIQGTIVASGEIAPGENYFMLPCGIYVVKVGNNVYKTIVR